jgi:hypothetical protein
VWCVQGVISFFSSRRGGGVHTTRRHQFDCGSRASQTLTRGFQQKSQLNTKTFIYILFRCLPYSVCVYVLRIQSVFSLSYVSVLVTNLSTAVGLCNVCTLPMARAGIRVSFTRVALFYICVYIVLMSTVNKTKIYIKKKKLGLGFLGILGITGHIQWLAGGFDPHTQIGGILGLYVRS